MREFTCECGRPKSASNVEACSSCRFLDGTYSGARNVISILRTVGVRLTTGEIAALTGQSYNNVTGILKRLVRDGRAVRFSESETIEAPASVSGVVVSQRVYYELVSRRPRIVRAAERSQKRRAAAKVRYA